MSEATQDTGEIPKEARTMAMAAHLLALTGLLGNGIGFLLGPLLVWMFKKDEHPFIDDQGKEALNFQITMFFVIILCFLSLFVLIGFVLLPIAVIVNIIFPIIGGMKANNGEYYRYPFAVRLIK